MFYKSRNLNFNKNIVFLLFLVIFSGCADRERSNPLDPQNIKTNGQPVGIELISIGAKNLLRWDEVHLDGFKGVVILRKSSFDTVYKEIAMVTGQTSYEDHDIQFGVKYTYKIRYVTESYQSPFSDEISITPGPSFIWVTTGSGGGLIKLTHDASHRIFERNQFLYSIGIASLGYNQGIFLSDFYLDQLVRITESGNIISWITNFTSPLEIDYDQQRSKIWIVDRDAGEIVVTDTAGTVFRKVANFHYPVALSLDQNTGDCWIADTESDEIGFVNGRTLIVSRFANFINPADVDANYADGSCWVADSSRVVKLNKQGNILVEVPGFNEAINVAVNEKTSECWVIDWYLQKNRSKVVKLAQDGTKQFELEGFYDPQSLDVDTFDGSCIVADRLNFRVVKISNSAEIIGEWRTSGPPRMVKVVTP